MQHTLCQRRGFTRIFTIDVNTICCGLFLSRTPPHTLTLTLTQLHSKHADRTNLAERQQPFQKLFSARIACQTSWFQSPRTAWRASALWWSNLNETGVPLSQLREPVREPQSVAEGQTCNNCCVHTSITCRTSGESQSRVCNSHRI